MRTPIDVQDTLLRRAKRAALERDCSLGEVIDQALRESFAAKKPGPRTQRTRLPTFRGRGVQPGVDLDSSSSLLDTMEGR